MEQGKIIEAEVRQFGWAPPPPQPPRFFTGRMPFLPPNQQHQSTEGKKALKTSMSENIIY